MNTVNVYFPSKQLQKNLTYLKSTIVISYGNKLSPSFDTRSQTTELTREKNGLQWLLATIYYKTGNCLFVRQLSTQCLAYLKSIKHMVNVWLKYGIFVFVSQVI